MLVEISQQGDCPIPSGPYNTGDQLEKRLLSVEQDLEGTQGQLRKFQENTITALRTLA